MRSRKPPFLLGVISPPGKLQVDGSAVGQAHIPALYRKAFEGVSGEEKVGFVYEERKYYLDVESCEPMAVIDGDSYSAPFNDMLRSDHHRRIEQLIGIRYADQLTYDNMTWGRYTYEPEWWGNAAWLDFNTCISP